MSDSLKGLKPEGFFKWFEEICRIPHVMRYEENWAIKTERIRSFFAAQPDVMQTAEGFTYGNCQIRLIPVSGRLLGRWEQQRTIVRMEGPEEDTVQIHQRFFLQFLSAGG